MLRDVATITAELNQVAGEITLFSRAGLKNVKAISRFHELREEQKVARRAHLLPFVYFVHAPDAGLVKIGLTANIETRLASLRMGSPVPLVLLKAVRGGRTDEAALHSKWGSIRCHGEWFRATDDLLGSIDNIDGAL